MDDYEDLEDPTPYEHEEEFLRWLAYAALISLASMWVLPWLWSLLHWGFPTIP